MPILGRRLAVRRTALLDRGARPLGVVELEQRQIEEPFARIVDDIDMQTLAVEPPLPELGRLIFEREPELADAPRTLRPGGRVAGEIGKMLLIFEARDDLVRLRFQIGAQQAPLGGRVEERQPAAGDEIVHERGDEHGLAGAGEPGHAEPHRRRNEAGSEVADIADGIAGGMRVF